MFSIKESTQALIRYAEKYPEKTKEIAEIFVDFLESNKETYRLSSIIDSLERRAEKKKKENTLQISLFKLVSQKTIQEIKKFIGVSNLVPTDIRIDKKIRGGFITQHQGTIFDASVRNQFIKLKNTLKEQY